SRSSWSESRQSLSRGWIGIVKKPRFICLLSPLRHPPETTVRRPVLQDKSKSRIPRNNRSINKLDLCRSRPSNPKNAENPAGEGHVHESLGFRLRTRSQRRRRLGVARDPR